MNNKYVHCKLDSIKGVRIQSQLLKNLLLLFLIPFFLKKGKTNTKVTSDPFLIKWPKYKFFIVSTKKYFLKDMEILIQVINDTTFVDSLFGK